MKKYNMLTIIKEVSPLILPSGQTNKAFLCRCDCGSEKEVVVSNLKSGSSKSCGCLKAEKTGERRRKHGFSKTTMYYRYKHMIQRCYIPTNPEYRNYGGRGIKVCDRALSDHPTICVVGDILICHPNDLRCSISIGLGKRDIANLTRSTRNVDNLPFGDG